MFTRLERNAYVVLVLLALCAAVMAASPTPAQAQAAYIAEDTRNARANLSHVVVRPGDSLWSLSEGRLGPNATPQRVADAAQRIHALNRGRIGADPNLIFVGQELLIRPALSERPAGATLAPETGEPAEVGARDRTARGTTGTTGKAPKPAPRTVAGGAGAKGGEAPVTAAHQKAEPVGLPALPDAAVAAPVPAVASLASNDSPTSSIASFLRTIRAEVASAASALAESFFAASADARVEGRRLLGLGVLVSTLLVAGLLAWKLPMRRTTRGDAERWGTPAGHYGYHRGAPATHRVAPFAYHSGSPREADARPTREGGPRAPEEAPGHKRGTLRRAPDAQTLRSRAEEYILRPESREEASPGNHEATNGGASATSRIRKAADGGRGRVPKAKKVKAVARNGLALGAHNPEVRRAPLRARATMRARRPRPRPRHGRGVGARGGR